MKTENMPEPRWLGIWDTIFSALILLLVFVVALPVVPLALVTALGINFLSGLPEFVQYLVLGLVPSLMVLKTIDSAIPITRKIEAGKVQFVKSMLPGDSTVYKINGGEFHILFPWFIDWRKAWSWDEKWQLVVEKYRVSLTGISDIIVTAVGSCRPDKNHLLPLHLIGNDNDATSEVDCTEMRKKFVVQNLLGVVRSTIESSLSGLKEECEREGGTRRIDSVEDIIERMDEAENALLRALDAKEEINSRRYGAFIDAMSLDDIGFPDKVEKKRDDAVAYNIQKDIAVQASQDAKAIGQEYTVADAILAAQIESERVTKTTNTSMKGIEPDTLKTVVKLAEPFLGLLAMKFGGNGQQTAASEPPSVQEPEAQEVPRELPEMPI